MMGASRASAAVVALVLGVGAPALAQPKEPSGKDKQMAGELVKKAIAKSQAGEHAAAIDIYLQAYTIVPNSMLLSNIGSEFQQENKPVEALRYFCMYLDKDPTGTNAPYAQSQAKALQIQLNNKNIDDKNVCAPKKEEPVEPVKPPKPPQLQPQPQPPEPVVEQPPPQHDDGGGKHQHGGTLRWVGVGAGVLGLAAVGGGVFYGLRAKQISDDITNHDKTMAWPDTIQQMEKDGQDYENLQIGLMIGGGIAVVAGVVLYVVGGPTTDEKPTIAVVPTSNGFAVSGRF